MGKRREEEADDGIRTHDLLHGKRALGVAPRVAESAWLSRILCVGRRVEGPRDSWRFPPMSGDLGMGWLLVPIRVGVVCASATVAAAQQLHGAVVANVVRQAFLDRGILN
jgi:hypothetical protein